MTSTPVMPDTELEARQDAKLAEAIKVGNVRVELSGIKPTGASVCAAHAGHDRVAVYLKWGRFGSSDFVFVHVTAIEGDPESGDFFATLDTRADGRGYTLLVSYENNRPVETEVVHVPE
jgi:hypothetical protein